MRSVLIVDGYFLTRIGLKQVLREEFRDLTFAEARTDAEALKHIEKQPWDLITLCAGIPDRGGLYVLQKLHELHPEYCVLVLSVQADPKVAAEAYQLGASGYLAKNVGRSEFVKAVKTVRSGTRYFEGTVSRPSASEQLVARHTLLSPREYKVMLALAAGKRSGEIARDLDLSIQTVSTFKRRVLNKMSLGSIADLVRYVMDHDLSSWTSPSSEE